VNDDQQLLQTYVDKHSEDAFAELVRRHVDFVYSAAVRMVRDSHLAEDVTQGVFVALAQNARQLTQHPILAGWLHRTAQNLAANAVRSDVRRRFHEQEAATMNELLSSDPDASWEQIAPELDAALGELSESDRDALLLRYFQRKSAQEMAQILGLSDDAAQKRVNRAVDRLRDHFSKHKVTIGASGLAGLISANAVQSAPVGLAATITSTVLAGTVASVSTVIAATKTIVMTTIYKTLITATLAVVGGAGIYEAHQNSQLRDQVQTLQQQQGPLAEQVSQLKAENKQLSDLLAQAKDQKSLSEAQFNELLKLRGQTGQTRTALLELAKMKSAGQSGSMPAYFTNAMAQGVAISERFKKKAALANVERMKEKLHLTDDQAQSISDVLIRNIENNSQQVLNAMTGRQTVAQNQADAIASLNEDDSIKALLTPDQLAAYPDFKQAETIASAKSSAQMDLTMMTGEMDLSQEQQDKVQPALYELALNQPPDSLNQAAIAQARAGGNYADVINLQIEAQKQTLENKLNALQGTLTPEQLKLYEQKQLDLIDMQTSAMKMFLPQTTNGVGVTAAGVFTFGASEPVPRP
jgi:RNA polymerase sigma factor (sigma-70 family)